MGYRKTRPPRNRRKTARLRAKLKRRIIAKRLKSPHGKRTGRTYGIRAMRKAIKPT